MPISHRKTNRLKDYDYSQPWWYYITICTKDKIEWFGEIKKGKIKLNQYGEIAYQYWEDIPKHFPNVELNEYIIMPNHIHGIVILNPFVGVADLRPLRRNNRNQMLLSKVIHGYKSSVTRTINKIPDNVKFQWQRSFYDHIIRTEYSCAKIREYITNNPLRWDYDQNAEDLFDL